MAGDDGVGVEVIRRLRERWGDLPEIILYSLEGDHFQIEEFIGLAERFIFVDAIAGKNPGELVLGVKGHRAFSPSFHQSDISSVMCALETFGICDPFPQWEIWGITISPPTHLMEGLSREIEPAVNTIYCCLNNLISKTLSHCAP